MNFFKNMSIGLKFFTASIVIVAVLFSIGWWSVNTIIECHHACTQLLGGAVNTKSLAQSAQAMVTDLRAVLAALNADPLMDKSLIAPFPATKTVSITILPPFFPVVLSSCRTGDRRRQIGAARPQVNGKDTVCDYASRCPTWRRPRPGWLLPLFLLSSINISETTTEGIRVDNR